jgi:FSR family fosmidomycin resistance protein-like MFS transporter
VRRFVAGIDARGITTLAIGHGAADFAQGMPAALLVFLRPKLDLSYSMAAGVVLACFLSSAVIQPVAGVFSDRRGSPWILSASLVLAGGGIGLATVAPTYALLLLVTFVAGIGIGVFHPEAAKFARYLSGRRYASGMSLFMIGGNVGIALAPIAAAVVVTAFGLHGGLLLAIPGLLAALLLLSTRSHLRRFVPASARGESAVAEPGQWNAAGLLLVVSLCRSITWFGMVTFVPLYEVAHGASKAQGTRVLTYILAAGALFTLVAGPLADRFGRIPVLLWTAAVCPPLIVYYVLHRGVSGSIAIALTGAMIISTFGVQVVLMQEYLPGRAALAAGLSAGVPAGLGSIFAVVLGAVADAINLKTALIAMAAAPAAAAVLTLFLPRPRAQSIDYRRTVGAASRP